MEALKLKTVHIVDDSVMDDCTIAMKLGKPMQPIRDISVQLKAFAEEVEINRIQTQGDPVRTKQLDSLRTSINNVRAELERAYWTLGSARLSFVNQHRQ